MSQNVQPKSKLTLKDHEALVNIFDDIYNGSFPDIFLANRVRCTKFYQTILRSADIIGKSLKDCDILKRLIWYLPAHEPDLTLELLEYEQINTGNREDKTTETSD